MNAFLNGMSRWYVVYFWVVRKVTTKWHLPIVYSCRAGVMRYEGSKQLEPIPPLRHRLLAKVCIRKSSCYVLWKFGNLNH